MKSPPVGLTIPVSNTFCLLNNITAEFQWKVWKDKFFFSKCLWISNFFQIFIFIVSNSPFVEQDSHLDSPEAIQVNSDWEKPSAYVLDKILKQTAITLSIPAPSAQSLSTLTGVNPIPSFPTLLLVSSGLECQKFTTSISRHFCVFVYNLYEWGKVLSTGR